jgi:hypothetical protein
MKYFNTLPKIAQNINGKTTVYTNLMTRISVTSDLLDNPVNYYDYDVQDGDTPEIIAHKYYGDVYRYWVVMFANQYLDPQWDWPMDGKLFQQYMQEKYTQVNPKNIVHHYEKTITQYNSAHQTTKVDSVALDAVSYNSTLEETYFVNAFGEQIKVTIDKQAVTLYDYEERLNETRRSIKLLNVNLVNEIEKQFKALTA